MTGFRMNEPVLVWCWPGYVHGYVIDPNVNGCVRVQYTLDGRVYTRTMEPRNLTQM